jgi:hypothetical protein
MVLTLHSCLRDPHPDAALLDMGTFGQPSGLRMP